MNIREKFSIVLISLGFILALLPLSANKSFLARPVKLLTEVMDENKYLTVDQVARLIVSEDSALQIIDLRSPEEFSSINIPGSLNIPYERILENEYDGYLNNGNTRKIFYSNGDYYSNYAMVIACGLNYSNVFVMKGGLNEWYNTIMNSQFKGNRISARENALFETRTKARRLFTEINSLPDSLKLKFMEDKQIAAMKLDGGCE